MCVSALNFPKEPTSPKNPNDPRSPKHKGAQKSMLGACLDAVRASVPLVHNITNYVTVNDVANVLLACGGSPIMSDEPEDVDDITALCGGLNLNIVPGECYCTIDMRLTPPTTNEQSIRLVEEAIAEGCANVPGTSCTYTVLAQRPAVEKDNDSYLLKMLRAATKDVTGEEAPVDFFPGYTDTAVIAATTGNRNCMSYGPGDLFYAHKPDEFVELDDITRCTRVMTRLAESILIDA